MNFIAHYYFNRAEDNPLFNTGLVLPDLMGIFKRGWKFKYSMLNQISHPLAIQTGKGILQHYEMDAIFHDSEYFLRNTYEIKLILNREINNFPNSRKQFIAHILLELVLDKLLILKDDELLDNFYYDLTTLEEEIMKRMFNEAGLHLFEGFYPFFEKFRRERYLQSYIKNSRLIFVLNKILERVDLPGFLSEYDKERLNVCIVNIEKLINSNFEELSKIVPQKV